MKLNSIFRHIILSFVIILSLGGFTSCSEEEQTTTVEISNVDYGFLEASKVNDFDQVVIEEASKPTNFNVGTDYFFILQFSITTRTNYSDSLLQTTIEIENSKFLNGELSYTNSGSDENSKISITDADTGDKGFVINSSHKIPQNIDGSREVKIVIKINTLNAGNTMMKYNFYGSSLKIIGESDGLTKNLVIDKVQIEKPEIIFNTASLELHWNHVKNADYYKFYVDGAPLIIDDIPVIYETDEYVADGAEIVFFITNYISGVHRVKIQAFSNNANYLPSSYSNEVDVII